jgi:nucleoside-triphosphatase THEP1
MTWPRASGSSPRWWDGEAAHIDYRRPGRRQNDRHSPCRRARSAERGRVGLEGTQAIIAHVDFAKTHRVSKYGVDIAAIDTALDATLEQRRGTRVYLIDEIGKMECLSARFVTAVSRLLDGRVPVVATVAKRGEGFISDVKRRADCELWTLTRENRDAMPAEILKRVLRE